MPPNTRRTAPVVCPKAQVFRPTMEEFKDFSKYIEFIESNGGHEAGICKIIPPDEWVPRKSGYAIDQINFTINGPIRQQFESFGPRGVYQTRNVLRQSMSVKEYYVLANSHVYRTPPHKSFDDLERKYWKSLNFVSPIYGCDVAANLSDPDLKVWNLSKLNTILDFVLDDLDTIFEGVNSTYLYFGMWKATFSLHVEDMDLYAINMIHYGEPKTWYCVPPKYGHLLEEMARKLFPNMSSMCSNFMRHKTCLFSPMSLKEYGIPFQKVVQEAREIIIVFPYAYHCGFNHGFNIAESTNFAMPRWIEYGKRARLCNCLSSKVQFSMNPFVKRFQPDKYEDWITGKDIAPHPEDPSNVVEEIRLLASNPEKYKQMKEELKKLSCARGSASPFSEETHTAIKYDVYQHYEQSNVKVDINPKNFKTTGPQMRLLKCRFNCENIDLKQWVEQGLLIRTGSRTIVRKKKSVPSSRCTNPLAGMCVPEPATDVSDTSSRCPEASGSASNKLQSVQVNLQQYVHPTGTVFKVHPETLEPFHKLPSSSTEWLSMKDLRQVITEGLLVPSGQVQVQVDVTTLLPIFARLDLEDCVQISLVYNFSHILYVFDSSQSDLCLSKLSSHSSDQLLRSGKLRVLDQDELTLNLLQVTTSGPVDDEAYLNRKVSFVLNRYSSVSQESKDRASVHVLSNGQLIIVDSISQRNFILKQETDLAKTFIQLLPHALRVDHIDPENEGSSTYNNDAHLTEEVADPEIDPECFEESDSDQASSTSSSDSNESDDPTFYGLKCKNDPGTIWKQRKKRNRKPEKQPSKRHKGDSNSAIKPVDRSFLITLIKLISDLLTYHSSEEEQACFRLDDLSRLLAKDVIILRHRLFQLVDLDIITHLQHNQFWFYKKNLIKGAAALTEMKL